MPLQEGARLGPYEVLGLIGAGGMGEVYRARDTRLSRTVAIKVLLSAGANDPAARDRLNREAKVVGALSHPHICPLFDIGHQEGIDFLVMEFLDGETLAHRLARGKLSLDEALQYGTQIADALASAHKAGITHRDLKPANVMLTKGGAKLLDFGLAKPRPEVVSGESVTQAEALTSQGTVLGTLQYMAPEQLEGKEADARTDIFAFGLTLYEMIAGRRAFQASSDASLISAILRNDPAPVLSSTQPVPIRSLDHVVRTCLAKDPDDRWQSAGDVKRELAWIRAEQGTSFPEAVVPSLQTRLRRHLITLGVVLLLVAVTVLAVRFFWITTEAPSAGRFSILLPDSAIYSPAGGVQLSPDGKHLASSVGLSQPLWLRSLDASSAAPIPGTEANALFWSPDSQELGFTTLTAVKKLTLSDRRVETITENCRPGWGGTWSRTGLIVFPSVDGTLVGVSAAGGEPRPITTLDRSKGEIAHIAPSFLPDGQRYLYVIRNSNARQSGLYIGQLGSRDARLLLSGEHPAIYAAPGYLVFVRAGAIVAQPFDLKRLELSGDVFPIVGPSEYWPVPVHGGNGFVQAWFGSWPSFSASETGTLTYAIVDHPELQFQWMARTGQLLRSVGDPGAHMTFDLASDDSRVVFSRGEGALANLWMLDLTRGVTERLTFGASSSYYDPRWAGTQWVGANKAAPPPAAVVRILTNGTESTLTPPGGEPCMLDDVSKDAHFLLCRRQVAQELVVKSLDDRRSVTLIRKAPAGYIEQGQFSGDGHWIAYSSNESGRSEVYVSAFPPTAERWQVSDTGGVQPVWRQDGRELYFLGLDGTLKAVTRQSGDSRPFSTPNSLFDTGLKVPSSDVEQYAVSADAQRFLVLKPLGLRVKNSVGVILNWPELLQNRRSH